jgi:hypothetical protein
MLEREKESNKQLVSQLISLESRVDSALSRFPYPPFNRSNK